MLIENIKTAFTQYKNQAEVSGFSALREQAYNEFEKLGLPTTKNEEWKYTNLKALANKDFESTCVSSGNVNAFLQNALLNKITANKLVFVNGTFNAELSEIIERDNSIFITNLAKARSLNADIFNQHFGKYANIENNALNSLNTALLCDGAFIYVPNNKIVEFPIFIVNIADSSDVNVLNQPRNLIIVEKSAAVHLIEMYYYFQ